MKTPQRVLIVGAGIAGATTAYTLARDGHDVLCVDIVPTRSIAGTGICLLENSLRAMKSIGLLQPILDVGASFEVRRDFDHQGNLVNSAPMPPSYGVMRPELARVLEDAAEAAGARIERGVTVASLTDHGAEVEVTLTDGRQLRFDLVVAADGAYSPMRDKVFGLEYRTQFGHQSGWRFSATRPAEVDGMCIYREPGGYTVGAIPTSPSMMYLFVLENSPEPIRIPDDQLRELLLGRLKHFTARTVRDSLAQVLRNDQVLFRPFDATLVPAPWYRGRVAIMGDAAHSPTPQMTSGGGMAIEDGVVLAESMRQAESVPQALSLYSERRFERVKFVWETSITLSRMEQDIQPGHVEKATALSLACYAKMAEPF